MKNQIDRELIKAWIDRGNEDLLLAKTILKERNFYDQICWLSQQAVEKHIKAVILAVKGEITKKERIHNLIVLAEKCKPLINLSQFEEELRILTEAYLPARYHDEAYFKAFSKEEAERTIEIAERIINFIKGKLRKILK